jgi:hypothetical protein
MKFTLILLIGISSLSFMGEVKSIRENFHSSLSDEIGLRKIVSSQNFPNSYLTRCYKGVAKSMLAEFAFFPTTKLQYFNSGTAMIDQSIKANSTGVELRYLRLLVQINAPSLLGYSSKIVTDLNYLKSKLPNSSISNSWKVKFINNLLAGKYLNKSQKDMLKELKVGIK